MEKVNRDGRTIIVVKETRRGDDHNVYTTLYQATGREKLNDTVLNKKRAPKFYKLWGV